MKYKMPCELIRDLFPSYVDELTSDVTNDIVEDHVKECMDCKNVLDAMKTKDVDSDDVQDQIQEKEIDFLKKMRKRTRRIVIGSVMSGFLLFFVLVFSRVFVVGEPVGSESVYCEANVSGNVLTLESTMIDSARVPSDVAFEEEQPGVINVSYRAVLSSPWNNRGTMASEYTSDSQIKQVKVSDRIIWADGEDIMAMTSALYATRHPYVGDMPANAIPLTVLNMWNHFGGFSNELQTKEEPYGWIFRLSDEIPSQRVSVKEAAMRSYAYVLLAVVENLGEVTYEYSSKGVESKLTVTKEDASVFAGHDIKDCYENIVLLQNLIKKTGLDDYAFLNTDVTNEDMQEVPTESEIHINIVNNAEDDIFSMGLSYGVDGDWKGEQNTCRADNECLKRGESSTFIIYPQDLELFGWDGITEAEFEARVSDTEDNYYKVQGIFKVPAAGGTVYTYVLTGNAKDGYKINQ
ncbi:MAG: DUF4825 domain-containing protein [Lachnospiraceae bacterium]|nr:DUF4825 domain-containing protein [Lachnospiraceae bacterium]